MQARWLVSVRLYPSMGLLGLDFCFASFSGFFKRLGIRLRFLGDFSYLPSSLRSSLRNAAHETAVACEDPEGQGCKMLLTVCIAYGSRNELARALSLTEGITEMYSTWPRMV